MWWWQFAVVAAVVAVVVIQHSFWKTVVSHECFEKQRFPVSSLKNNAAAVAAAAAAAGAGCHRGGLLHEDARATAAVAARSADNTAQCNTDNTAEATHHKQSGTHNTTQTTQQRQQSTNNTTPMSL